ncbi:hypothetical protein Q1695_000798 [Nippostrongylus brasiliensis]|nr:hypothetical protein Q1695_000798 [Nippostrongylus brasiliensis]
MMRSIYILALATAACFGRPNRIDDKVTAALNNLVTLDARLDGDTTINYQNMASHKDFSHDNAPDPLYTAVSASSLTGATYKAYDNLIVFYQHADVDVEETVTSTWQDSISAFLDAVMNTKVVQSAQTFLVQQGLASADPAKFKDLLNSLWFTTYARNKALGSSGFESVFSGEVQGTNVIRFNNWLRYYEQEKAGLSNYHGWFTREKGVQLSLQFEWNNFQALETNMLLNTSPEFEIAVYTICALSGGECDMTINNQAVTIFASTLQSNGVTVIDQCYPAISASTGTTKKGSNTTKKPAQNDAALQSLVDQMRKADVDKAGPNDYTLDWGKLESGNKRTSTNPLFARVNEDLYKRPVYSTLISVFNNSLFTPDVCTAEPAMSGFRKATIQQMLDTWAATDVFNLFYQYLNSHGNAHATNVTTLKAYLWNLWFGTYSRCGSTLGSSGWEHVFVGEWRSGTLDGQHDWTRYYLLQKADHIIYHGYFSYVGNLTGTFQYTWDSEFKQKGGFLIGTSPVFDYALLSVCAMTHPGEAGCKFSIDGHPLSVTSYTQSCAAGTCLSTAYPEN